MLLLTIASFSVGILLMIRMNEEKNCMHQKCYLVSLQSRPRNVYSCIELTLFVKLKLIHIVICINKRFYLFF